MAFYIVEHHFDGTSKNVYKTYTLEEAEKQCHWFEASASHELGTHYSIIEHFQDGTVESVPVKPRLGDKIDFPIVICPHCSKAIRLA